MVSRADNPILKISKDEIEPFGIYLSVCQFQLVDLPIIFADLSTLLVFQQPFFLPKATFALLVFPSSFFSRPHYQIKILEPKNSDLRVEGQQDIVILTLRPVSFVISSIFCLFSRSFSSRSFRRLS